MTAFFPRDKDTHSLKLEFFHRIEGQPGAAADEDEDGIEALARSEDLFGRVEERSEGGRREGMEIDRGMDTHHETVGPVLVIEEGVATLRIQHRQTDGRLVKNGHRGEWCAILDLNQ